MRIAARVGAGLLYGVTSTTVVVFVASLAMRCLGLLGGTYNYSMFLVDAEGALLAGIVCGLTAAPILAIRSSKAIPALYIALLSVALIGVAAVYILNAKNLRG